MYSLLDALPYSALMLSLAVCPLLLPKLWHMFEKPALAAIGVWTLVVMVNAEGVRQASHSFSHMLLHEYIAFLALIFALFVVAGGIHVQFNVADSLKNNILILLGGAILANFIGTTGASMVLIRPFLKLNHNRPYKTHLGVFFIFIVANIGGSLTPLGDPPLFMGYLAGVDFSWTLQRGWLPFIIVITFCLFIFAYIDRLKNKHAISQRHDVSISLEGRINFILMAAIVVITLLAPKLSSEAVITIMDVGVSWQDIIRDFGYLAIGSLSLWLTPSHIRHQQHFNFEPFKEVARVFLVIFLSLIPISAMLKRGINGPFHSLFSFAHENGMPIDTKYFWLSGSLSALLDNAPTYLLFFKMAGGDAGILMNQLPSTLLAISLGSVYMGAMSYIGNAPNFMVRSIAKQSGVEMPSFIGYMVWSCVVLLPILYCISLFLKYF
jgi:Na+/H+ antiporter NhaD/arsenite permease-like protein